MWAGKYIGIERYSSNGDYYSEFNGMNIEAVTDAGFSKGGRVSSAIGARIEVQ